MKTIRFNPILFFALFFSGAFAGAQPRVDVYFGLGTAQVGSTKELFDFFGTGNYKATSSMGGAFGILGGGVMLTSGFGAGAEVALHFTQKDYAGLGSRPIFYDFNGIWTPTLPKRILRIIQPEFQAGFGGLNLRFYGGSQYYSYTTGSYTNFLGSSNHFQLHAGAGLRLYIKRHVFLRPQLDYHYVKNLSEFSSNSVPQFSLVIGYSFSP